MFKVEKMVDILEEIVAHKRIEIEQRYILVEDCLTTFKELAREHRRLEIAPVSQRER